MSKAIINAILFLVLTVLVVLTLYCFIRRRRRRSRRRTVLPSHGARADRLQAAGSNAYGVGREEALVRFLDGEGLMVAAILEAPGEVLAKSAHNTLYRARLSSGEAVALLRLVWSACSVGVEEAAATRLLGAM